MITTLKEILNTSLITVENEEEVIAFPLFEYPRILRISSVSCGFCNRVWNAGEYEGVKHRICGDCRLDIAEEVFELKENFEYISKTIVDYEKVLEDIIEVGFNPDRTWQTQLADTLPFFKQPSY